MTTLSNLCVLFFAIGKVALLCGFLPGIAIAVCFEKFLGCPVVQSRLAASLADWRMRARNGRTSQETVGNRASSPRTAQRRVNDLTNTGAPWESVEAAQEVRSESRSSRFEKRDGQLARLIPNRTLQRATSPSRKVRTA